MKTKKANFSGARHEHGERSFGAGNAASHLLPQSAGYASNVSKVRHENRDRS